jgi:hypothetical protein
VDEGGLGIFAGVPVSKMKIALCTTTIHVPHALKLLRKCSEDVRFFVALDEKSPFAAIASWDGRESRDPVRVTTMTNTEWLAPSHQKKWKCSEAIGWNTLARRNIAFLEALKWGADVIYSWDNDNLPTNWLHFSNLKKVLAHPFDGIKVTNTDSNWFDPGSLLIPATRQRGIPWNHRNANWAEPVTDAKVGVVSGLIFGDPDCDASTRIEKSPDIGALHVLGQVGVVVDPNTWTIFNSQNTALLRELMPAFFLMPGVGRHDDVFGSLIVQRVMRERGYHVHLGAPFCYQARNPHNLVTDLRAEIDGMERVTEIANALDAFRLMPGASVVEHTRALYIYLASLCLIPDAGFAAAMAWLEDCEGLGL